MPVWSRIRIKLPLLVIGGLLLTGAAVGVSGFVTARKAIEADAIQKLQAIQSSNKFELRSYMQAIADDLILQKANRNTMQALDAFSTAWKILDAPKQILQDAYITNNPYPTGEKDKLYSVEDGNTYYHKVHELYHPYFHKLQQMREYYDVFLFDADGNLVYSVFKESDFATNVNSGRWKDTDLGNAFRAAMALAGEDDIVFFDFRPYGPSNGDPASFVATPVLDANNRKIGVLAFQMPIHRINGIMSNPTGLGETGESYLVGGDFVMRSQSRLQEDNTILAKRVQNSAIEAALNNEAGFQIVRNDSNNDVLTAYSTLNYYGTRWAVVTEITAKEAFAFVDEMRLSAIIQTLLAALVLGAISILFVRNIVNAINMLSLSIEKLANGEQDVALPDDRKDEIGDIARALDIIRREAANTLRVKAALDATSANVMMADANRDLVYMNQAVTNMMRGAQSDLRQDLPHLDVDTLIGSSIDLLHKNPAHQMTLLDGLRSQYEAHISVGGREFDLIANPIFNEKNDRLGSVVEWEDVTQEYAAAREIELIVENARAGDLSQRISEDGKEGFYLTLAGQINGLLDVTEDLIGDVGNGLKSLAAGDLGYSMDEGYQGKFRELSDDFTTTNTQLSGVVSSILGASQEMRHSTREMSAASDDLSARTQSQASNIEQTAASLEEIAQTVRINKDNAVTASQNAGQAVSAVDNGRSTVASVVEIISDLKKSSTKINEITGLIEEIAFQTNLLALNASVEAARAGDAGKGFSVVADEVRQLAHRTASASKEIKQLIETSTTQVDTGVLRAGEASTMLEKISDEVTGAATLMNEVATASGEQALGVTEINTSMTKLDEITQQNAAMVEQTSATATNVAQLAAETDEIMSFFDIPQATGQRLIR